MEAIAIAVFALWFVLSVLVQFQTRLSSSIRNHDYFSFLPSWTFFAPNPDFYNYHILYRDKLTSGTLTEFKEACLFKDRYYRFIWNPTRRIVKAVMDCTNIISAKNNVENHDIANDFSYVLLANFVRHLQHDKSAAFTQFAVYRTTDNAAPELLLISELLPVIQKPLKES